MGREACQFPGISRSFQVVSRSAAFCHVLLRLLRQARVYGSRFVAFNDGASRCVTVYGPGAIRRVALCHELPRRAWFGREHMKAGPGEGSFIPV